MGSSSPNFRGENFQKSLKTTTPRRRFAPGCENFKCVFFRAASLLLVDTSNIQPQAIAGSTFGRWFCLVGVFSGAEHDDFGFKIWGGGGSNLEAIKNW